MLRLLPIVCASIVADLGPSVHSAADAAQLMTAQGSHGQPAAMFLKAAASQLTPVLSAQINAWMRVGQLPANDALSCITAIPKPGAAPGSCDGLRGIAVGTLPAKLFAAVLEQRVSDWAEACGCRAEGQFGFRRKRSTEQAALVLRKISIASRSSSCGPVL
jgi:hypothetical protein